MRNDQGDIVGFVKVSRDITEWQRVQDELELARARLKAVIEGSTDIIGAVDMECRLILLNRAYAEEFKLAFGLEVQVGDRLPDLLASAPAARDLVMSLWSPALKGEQFTREVELTRVDGTKAYHEVKLSRVEDSSGKQIGAGMVVRDITARKEAELRLRQAAADLARSNAELEQFAYVASHDLQEPLRAVTGCVQIVRQRYADKLDSRGMELIGHAVDGVARMQALINDLLTYSRVSTRGKALEAVPSGRALQSALTNLSERLRETNGEIQHNGLPQVCADETQLTQLFQNLIGNALKYCREKPVVQVSAEQRDGMIEFRVQDNGIGIEKQYFERIFGVFQRLHTRGEFPGNGIGLAICKKIVERHGGAIWVESTPGLGSAFHFTLPNITTKTVP